MLRVFSGEAAPARSPRRKPWVPDQYSIHSREAATADSMVRLLPPLRGSTCFLLDLRAYAGLRPQLRAAVASRLKNAEHQEA
jgi:hypothetical protein